MNNIFILLTMIFLHIIDDFKLQAGVLNYLKQKSWWKEQKEYRDLYKYDYISALIMHSFSWSFMIMLPIAFALNFNIGKWIIAYIVNMFIHAFVDDLKANKLKINLVVDQSIHIVQIVVTWLIFVFMR